MNQATALIDCNNFYASCEQSIDPALIGRPLVVLSNNDGCIIARSAEARILGIKMGQPYFKVRSKLERLNVEVRSSNYALYGDMSHRLMSLLAAYCDQLETYSIDEAFMQLRFDRKDRFHPWAQHLRASTHQSLGLPISIGLGRNKVQAKIANHIAKTVAVNAGIFDLLNANQDSCLEEIEIERVWGIGRKLSYWCRLRNIKNARQLRDMNSGELYQQCGVIGLRIQEELKGKKCLPLINTQQAKNETRISRSFKSPITNKKELKEIVSSYVVRAGEKLRKQKQYASSITIFANTNPFKPDFCQLSANKKLEVPSNDTFILLKISNRLTEEIFQPHLLVIKAGVIMQGLQNLDYLQPSLIQEFNAVELKKRERLMEAIDKLNRRYGTGTMNWAVCGLQQTWRMNQKRLSSSSTTNITAIPIVYT